VLLSVLLYNNAMQANSIRAVLFDFGGVLVEEGFREGLYDLARQQGLNPQTVHLAAYDAIYESGYVLGRGTEDEFWRLLCQKAGLCGDIEPLRQALASRFALRPLMLAVVRSLRQQGYITAILSDQTDWLDRMDAKLHFFQDFDKVYNSYHLGKGKRDPSVFDDVVNDLGLAPDHAVFVDDDPGNCERAQTRGLTAVLFLNEDQCIHDLEAAVGHPILER
jgi:putative hydrolase of the HAD superfamily